MRSLLFCIVVTGLMAACVPPPSKPAPTVFIRDVSYEVALSEAQRPAETRERWGEVMKIELDPSNRYLYEDKMIEAFFLVLEDRIAFEVRNKTDHSIKIIWDEAVFIDFDGQADRIMTSGVRYADRYGSRPPGVIPGNGKLTDVILPTGRVQYKERSRLSSGGWQHDPILEPRMILRVDGSEADTEPSDIEKAQANLGRRFAILLPLEIQGNANEYTFWFEVKNVTVSDPVTMEDYLLRSIEKK